MSLEIDIWSDVACPWCYIGKRRFEAALRGWAGPQQIDIRWRSFQLQPHAPKSYPASPSYAGRLAAKYGLTEEQARAMMDRVAGLGAKEGIAFDFSAVADGNTFDAHRLLHWARSQGAQDTLKESLLRAYFCEGRSASSSDSLLARVAEAGLDVDAASAVLASDEFADDVRNDVAEAARLGIGGVPFFKIGRYGVSGAQPTEVFAEALARASREAAPDEPNAPVEGGEGPAFCGPEGSCD